MNGIRKPFFAAAVTTCLLIAAAPIASADTANQAAPVTSSTVTVANLSIAGSVTHTGLTLSPLGRKVG
jgi:hypothetical protein